MNNSIDIKVRTNLLKVFWDNFSYILQNKALVSMVIPGLIFFFLFSYLPMFGIILAFKNYNVKAGIFNSPWAGLENFKFFFASQDAFRITYNTIFLNAIFIAVGLIFQVGFAIMLNEVKSRVFAKLSQSLMFLPYFVSWVIVGYFSYNLLAMDNGTINTLLKSIGLQSISWYNEPKFWPAILAIASIWKSTGYGSVIYLAAITGIGNEFYEAAIVDGATKIQQIFKITIPMIVPVITMLTLLSIGRIFYADFGMFYNMTRDSGLLFSTTDVIDTYVYRTLRLAGDIGMASAAGFYQGLVGFIMVLASNLMVKKFNSENALF